MGSYVDKLISKELIQPPSFLKNSIQYEVTIGSVAYGVSENTSDVDLYGFCIPSKEIVYPHLKGVIFGFDQNYHKFVQFQAHHVKDKEERKVYDIVIYNIVKYFRLCANGNPNMIDSLFVPRRCITHISQLGDIVRENRHLFLSKKCWHTHKGYAFSQLAKMKSKQNLGVQLRRFEDEYGLNHTDTFGAVINIEDDDDKFKYHQLLKKLSESPGTRHQKIREIGYDVKFGYHVVRLLNQVEQILVEQDLDLERNREQLKAIRRGDLTCVEIESYFTQKERQLEKVYSESKLRHKPAEVEIKELLVNCLEQYFGTIDKMAKGNPSCYYLIRDIEEVLGKYC